MRLDQEWSFEEALQQLSMVYFPNSLTTGPLRNRQLESWGQLVGRTRALAEFDLAIEQAGSLTAFTRKYPITVRTLRAIREFYGNLPDDRRRASIYPGLILGNWRLVSRLGKGGNAEVWRARDRNSCVAAIKILKHVRGASLKRFINEIVILNRLGDTTGILPILDSVSLEQVEQAEYVWLVLPIAVLVQNALSEQGNPVDILRGIADIANTLTNLHNQGIMHRDIKPDNVYVWKDEWVISDFGIASFPDKEALTVANQKLGPLHYIAPEMLQYPDTADARKADVYSLAKTLWALLTGQKYPPPGEQRRDVKFFRLSTWITLDNPDPIDELLERATKHNPESRPTMSEFRDDITDALS